MSCLPSDALSHFEQREQELLALNQELDQKKASALADASSAVRDVEASSLHSRAFRPPEDVHVAEAAPAMARRSTPEVVTDSILGASPMPSPAPRPPSSGNADGSETLHTTIRFQNARIVALQDELDKTIAELTSRESETTQLRQELKQATEENKKLQKASSSADQSQERWKKQLSTLDSKVQDLERERGELVSGRDKLEVQMRKCEAECSTKEARISHLLEESEKYKGQLKDSSKEDKDRAVADRRETDRLTAEVRKLERQRSELVNAFKKQMKLIDVLKRQRAHMEAARVLSFTEDEFIRILELGDKLGE